MRECRSVTRLARCPSLARLERIRRLRAHAWEEVRLGLEGLIQQRRRLSGLWLGDPKLVQMLCASRCKALTPREVASAGSRSPAFLLFDASLARCLAPAQFENRLAKSLFVPSDASEAKRKVLEGRHSLSHSHLPLPKLSLEPDEKAGQPYTALCDTELTVECPSTGLCAQAPRPARPHAHPRSRLLAVGPHHVRQTVSTIAQRMLTSACCYTAAASALTRPTASAPSTGPSPIPVSTCRCAPSCAAFRWASKDPLQHALQATDEQASSSCKGKRLSRLAEQHARLGRFHASP